MKEYLTIDRSAEAEFIEKKSKFIGHICPVVTEEEAASFIQSIKTKYWDATHHVSAFILNNGQIKRYSDDGEPRRTAGVPVLDVLEKEQLFDCAVVVTRYFGGVLLGAGGLVRAYSHACKLAVDAGEIVLMAPCAKAKLKCDYSFYEKLPKLFEKYNVFIEETIFEDKITLFFHLESKHFDLLNQDIFESSFGKYNLTNLEEIYAKIKRISQAN